MHRSLQAPLGDCFPGYPPRGYFKIPPHFRYVMSDGATVLGQLGVELGVIRVGILFADDDGLYRRNGFVRVDNPLTWVKIDEHHTIGLARSVTPHELMVRPVGGAAWPVGEIDLLGHVF